MYTAFTRSRTGIPKGGDIMKIARKGCKNPAAVEAQGCCPTVAKLRSSGAPEGKAKNAAQQTAKKG